MDIEEELRRQEQRAGLPTGLMSSIMKQETGGKREYLDDPTRYHYGLNSEGRRIAGHTGKVSTAFGPFGLLESTSANPGLGVEPLKDKSFPEQARFAADYMAARIKHAGSLEAGVGGYGEGARYATQVLGRLNKQPAAPAVMDVAQITPPAARSDEPVAYTDIDQLEATTKRRTEVREQATTANVFVEKFYDKRENALWNFVDRAVNAPDEDPNFSWMDYPDRKKMEKGLNPEELAFVRENATSPARVSWVQQELADRRRKDELYQEAGTARNLFTSLGVGIADPVGWLVGGGVGKGFQMARIGSRVLAAQGKTGLAVASAVGEGVVGNLAWEIAQDMSGEVKSLEDYGIAAAFGVGFSGFQIPGVVHTSYSSRVMNDAMDATRAIEDAAIQARIQDPRPSAVRGAEQAAEIDNFVRTNSAVRAADELGDDVAIPRELADEIRTMEDTPPAQAPAVEAEMPAARAEELAEPTDAPVQPDVEAAVADEAPRLMSTIDQLQTEAAQLDPGVPDQAARIEQIDGEVYRLQAQLDELPGPNREPVRQNERAPDGSPAGAVPGATMRVEDVLREGLKSDAAKIEGITDVAQRHQALTARAMATRLLDILPQRLRDLPAIFNQATGRRVSNGAEGYIERGAYRPADDTLILPGKDAASTPAIDRLGERNLFAVQIHEIVHAATERAIIAVQRNLKSATQDMKQAYQRLEELRGELTEQLKAEGLYEPGSESGANYATKNASEFVAQAMSDRETISVLARMPGRGYAEDNALGRVWRAVLQLFHIKRVAPGRRPMTAAEEAGQLIESLIRYGEDLPADISWSFEATVRMAEVPGYSKGTQGPGNLTATTDRRFMERMTQHANDWLARNPIDAKRLEVIGQQALRKGSNVRDLFLTDGLKMASSANPIVRMLSGLVVETTTGAAGRRPTAAIRKWMLSQSITGRSVVDYEAAYGDFRRRNGGGVKEDLLTGKVKRDYDKAVFEEIVGRRYGQAPSIDPAVREGADALQALFNRSLQAQKDGRILGSAWLPQDATGYVPQVLDGDKLASTDPRELEELADHLTSHWSRVYGWNRSFSREFSRAYLARAQRRANGERGVDFVAVESPTAAVRDTLEEMRLNSRSLNAATLATLDRVGAQPQNKARLDVDLLGTLPSGKRVLDFYSTDVEKLARLHAGRVSGSVALAEFNILGARGVNNLMRAIDMAPPDQRAMPEERAALARSISSILGTPVEGEVRSAVATNIAGLVSLQRLGGIAFTQLSETANLIHHMGLTTLFKGLAALPRMVGEVRELKNGRAVANDWLGSMETAQGFAFGMESFTMHARLDPPDELLRQYGKGNDVATRAVAAGRFLQAQLSFFRGLMASQHRATAELILKKAIGMIQDGGSDKMLADMGITPALARAIKADLPRAVLRDAAGNPVGFDITQLSTLRAQNDLLTAIHRGTGQIIQQNFVGESGAWASNDYMKVVLQLRTFGLTAMEKQWGRTRTINSGGPLNGYGYAVGVLMGQMAFATPIYLARVGLASTGREDREDFLDKALAPSSLMAATLNYTAMSGLGGDAFDFLATLGGGWSEDVKEGLGVRSYGGGVSSVVPALGSIDAAARVVTGKADFYTAFKQLPFSNLPYLVPVLNMLKEDE